MEYDGIQLNSCIPHNTVFATLQRAKAALPLQHSSHRCSHAAAPIRHARRAYRPGMVDNSMRIAQQLACTNIILRMTAWATVTVLSEHATLP